MSGRVRLALFDCDGTLVDSQANICRCVALSFADAGLPAPTDASIRRIVGLSLPEAMATLAPDADAATQSTLVADYRARFRRMREAGELDDEPLFDGIAAALDALLADGWTLGVATGKSDRGLAHVLARHGLTDRFATLQTADRHLSKPHPAMAMAALHEVGAAAADAAMIGDTGWDMALAHAAGLRAVGVAWGYHDAAELRAAGADAVANHASDLPGLLAA